MILTLPDSSELALARYGISGSGLDPFLAGSKNFGFGVP